MTDQTASIVVDITSSTCSHCGQPTLPSATRHTNVSGYDPKPGGGCGALFVDTRPGNSHITDWHLRRLRPDLPVHGADDDHANDDDGGVSAADFFGDGVYQPETDPAKIAAAGRSLDAIRDRLNRPAW